MSKKILDLVGKKFGRLTVIENVPSKGGKSQFKCLCDCGNEKIITGASLVRGVTQSCGCLSDENKRSRYVDMAGKRFGKLLITERNPQNNKWKYICDCGNTGEALRGDLIYGKVKSCGCERFKRKDITNQKFGKLTAKYPTGKMARMGAEWVCECECGNTVIIPVSNLINGHTRSCGCLNTDVETINRRKEVNEKYNVEGTRTVMLREHKTNKNNTSGVTGVTWNKRLCKWQAQICFKRKHYHLGYFDAIEDASHVRKLAEEQIFENFLEWYENEYLPTYNKK